MWGDPANVGLTTKELRAKFDAAVKEATRGLPGLPHPYLRKVTASIRADRLERRRELKLIPRGSSQRQRRRLVSERLRWHLKND